MYKINFAMGQDCLSLRDARGCVRHPLFERETED